MNFTPEKRIFSLRDALRSFFFVLFFAFVSENANAEYNNGIKRLYYSITEVSDLVDEEQYALRYWETEFPQLKPQKNRAGNRVYTEHDIKVIRDIQYLLRIKRLTIDAAKERLAPLYPEVAGAPARAQEGETVTVNTLTVADSAETAAASSFDTADEYPESAEQFLARESETPSRREDATANGFAFSRAPVAEWNAPFVGQFPSAIIAPPPAQEDVSPEEVSSEEVSSEEPSSEKRADPITTSSQNQIFITREELLDIRAALVEVLRLLTPDEPRAADGE